MLVKFEQNVMVQTRRHFELSDTQKKNKIKNKNKTKNKTKQKNGFFKTIFDKALTAFWKTFL